MFEYIVGAAAYLDCITKAQQATTTKTILILQVKVTAILFFSVDVVVIKLVCFRT